MRSLLLISVSGLLSLSPACLVEGSSAEVAQERQGISSNGVSFNGISFNGISFNGISFNGGQLSGVTADGVEMSGDDFTGATLLASTTDGLTVELRIDAMELAPLRDEYGEWGFGPYENASTPAQDVWFYSISYASDDGWQPLCGTLDTGEPRQAIAISGRWNYDSGYDGAGGRIDDPSSMTLACRGVGAIAKCVELGYKPWASVDMCTRRGICETVPLVDYHEACVRMIRADFCGNGVAHTVDGTLIDTADIIGVQTFTADGWYMEAEWTPDGARCLVHDRLSGDDPGEGECEVMRQDITCGAYPNFVRQDTLLMTTRYLPDVGLR